jgi:hypothetical protein
VFFYEIFSEHVLSKHDVCILIHFFRCPQVLRDVWNLAAVRGQPALSQPEFATALRLIALAQAGVPPSPAAVAQLQQRGASTPPTSLPTFVGLAGNSGDGGWTMSVDDKAKYEGLFPRYDDDGSGFISGAESVALLSKSGLDRNVRLYMYSFSLLEYT